MRKRLFPRLSLPFGDIWKNLCSYKFNSILIRYFLLITLLVFLPTAGMTLLFNINTRSIVQGEISGTNYSALRRSADVMETILDQVYSFAFSLSVSQETKWLTFQERNDLEGASTNWDLWDDTKLYLQVFEYIDSIYVYLEQQQAVLYDKAVMPLDQVSDRSWLHAYAEMGDASYVMQSRKKNDYYPYYMTMICPIKTGLDKPAGAIILNINIEKLDVLLGETGAGRQTLLILDEKGTLYYASEHRLMDQGTIPPEYLHFIQGRMGDFSEVVTQGGTDTVVSCVESERNAWRYVLYSPLSLYEVKMKSANDLVLKISVMASALVLVVSYLLALRSYMPIQRIMNEMEQPLPASEEYISGEGSKNELQYITNLVRRTQLQNRNLKMELDERMDKLNKAQMRALQSQINPHFLYNTLDAINWAAIDSMGTQNKVSTMISALAQLLRVSLQRSSYLASVEEELNHARLYVQLLETRYSDKLRVYWEVSPDILKCKTVRLCLQPLLENAISHGLRPKRYQGTITVRGGQAGGAAVISVEDDGVGMSAEECVAFNAQLKKEYQLDDSHVGLRNVNQRLKILFGDCYGVVLAPRKAGGLTVTIVFPM